MSTSRFAHAIILVLLATIAACSQRRGPNALAPIGDGGLVVDAMTHDAASSGSDAATTCTDALDIVFVLDVSTSMSDTLGDIRAGIADIWNTATGLSANAQFGMVVFVDDVVAVNDCAPISSLADLQAQFDHWRDFCSSNENPVSGGQNYDCPENSLDAIATAITWCPWRSPATRVVIHVTDDTFKERPYRLSDAVTVDHTYSEVASALVSNEIRFATFANAGGATCADYSGAPGFHTTYSGEQSLPEQTGGRAWDLDEVRNGSLNMGTAISQLLTEEYCTVFLF